MTVDEYVSLVGHNIRLLRERAEMSGLKLSKKTGVSQAEIEEMQGYRRDVFERMQEIYSAPYHMKIQLRRRKSETVWFYLELLKVYENGIIQPEKLSSTEYPGKDRAKAIAAFSQYVKEHPGIEAEMNIEKGRWER